MKTPEYTKCLKEALSNRKKLKEFEKVVFNEECSVIFQSKIPKKLDDPGSFYVSCIIGSLCIDKALADLRAGINVMPYSTFMKLGLGEPTPTRMEIQLADRSIRYPRGVVENVLIKVDKFIIPVDFIVLDMEEGVEIPLIN